ncbi:transposase Tn3 family protein [Klebsiella pneumoniae subsp. ozaenae]|uniref:Transposase Tn3 family protein n=1 Tax=Klebsiella pneumoniae subsp. ozaenae TaxID=574 RepID=A0A378UCC0_KLEPO|nr:transposase Tn3 family protein [Klebsiella pneumoniae subsp. ozaenae]
MDIERQYVDSHGQSEVAFAFSYLLGFDLLPRLKAIASQKLYRTGDEKNGDYSNLDPVLTRTINWELIIQQYDEMIKYATALKQGTQNQKPFYAGLPGTTFSIRLIRLWRSWGKQ